MGRTRKTANLVNDLVGIDTTAKSTFTDIDFSGDIAGDGSELSGIAAGLGTGLSSDTTNPLSNIYYTNQVLEFDNTATVDVPSSAKVAYTQFAEIQVNGTADLIIADEAHKLRKSSSQVHKSFLKLKSNRTWLLTGTPIENNIEDIKNILYALDKSLVADSLDPVYLKSTFQLNTL